MKIAKCAEGSLNQRVSKLKENELQVRVQGPEEELAMCDHMYDAHRDHIKQMIEEPDKKIVPKTWEKELDSLQGAYEKTKKPYADTVVKLSAIEVLEYNKKDLERMLENESHVKRHTREREQSL